MKMSAMVGHRLSDYPNRPEIYIAAPLPIDMYGLRAYILRLRDDKHAGLRPSWFGLARDPDMFEDKKTMFDSASADDEFEFFAFA